MALNRRAVLQGAIAALWLVVPAVVVNAWVAGSEEPNRLLAFLSLLVTLVGFVFGGFSAARTAGAGTPLIHAAAGAALAWGVVQVISIAIRVSRGDELRPVQIVFTALLAASAGVLGGLLASRTAPMRRNP